MKADLRLGTIIYFFMRKRFLILLLAAFALPTVVYASPRNRDIKVEFGEKRKFMNGPILGDFLSKNYLEQS